MFLLCKLLIEVLVQFPITPVIAGTFVLSDLKLEHSSGTDIFSTCTPTCTSMQVLCTCMEEEFLHYILYVN